MKSNVSHAKKLISRWFQIPQEITLPGRLPFLGGRGERGGRNRAFLSPPSSPSAVKGEDNE